MGKVYRLTKSKKRGKVKLTDYIRKPDGSLKADVVCQDNQCALGKWIYGEGATFSKDPTFADLKKTYAEFHRCAADTARTRKQNE